jgi:hypothetical protein
MSDLVIEMQSPFSSMQEARPALDAALAEQFPGGMLQRRWDGDVLRLSGPGAEGSISLNDGHLVGRAELKPPASLMRPIIEQKISAAMKKATG